jgi:hypothetical protein
MMRKPCSNYGGFQHGYWDKDRRKYFMNHRKPQWAKKVPPEKIKRLYEQDAKGIYDEELADDVGIN